MGKHKDKKGELVKKDKKGKKNKHAGKGKPPENVSSAPLPLVPLTGGDGVR